MTEREAQLAVRPLASGVHVGPSEDEPLGLSSGQERWLKRRGADDFTLEIGPHHFLPDGTLIVTVETPFERPTFFIDREGNEIE